ncbi:MAG: phosphoglycerate dehydrogenase [Euryarchaeota archaeon]|nr:phosphoglycerate dehydrogenase [Euryarchaeota archaeon]
MKVLVADALSEAGIEVLRKRGLTVDVRVGLKEDELAKIIGAYDGLIVRSATKATRRLLEAGKNLKVVGRAGVGVDNIDEAAATERGILVMNTPAGNTLSAAEHTMALLLSLARQVPQAAASMKRGEWDRKSYAGVELAGKTLGIVGLGRIGREVAARSKAFQMRIVAFDPFISPEVAKEFGVELGPMDRLLSESDFLTIHTPLTQQTDRLLGAAELAKMKKGARILNVARGGIVDEKALHEALVSGRLAGAALDVFVEEPPKGSPLLSVPSFIGTPHLGASTQEAQEKVALQVAEQIAEYLSEGKIQNAVNLTVPPHPQLLPYIELVEHMGSFASQIADGNPVEVHVECRGEMTKHNTHPVAVAGLAGVLSRASEERVNLVNAERKAKEHGLRLVHSQTQAVQDYTSSARLTLRTSEGEVTLLGTHLARLGARVVEVQSFEVEFKPHGRFLVIQHRDQPGTIAKISSILGRENINIAQMVVGRESARGKAFSILRVDDPVSPAILDEIRKALNVPNVRQVVVRREGHPASGAA